MSLTILYRHPQRPDEAGITVVVDHAQAALMKSQLERRGYRIVDVVVTVAASTT